MQLPMKSWENGQGRTYTGPDTRALIEAVFDIKRQNDLEVVRSAIKVSGNNFASNDSINQTDTSFMVEVINLNHDQVVQLYKFLESMSAK
jgi:hypothetical protein